MKILHSEDEFAGRASVVALGMFDGVHIGHQKLIRTASELAKEMGADCIVCTFDQHPLALLRPEIAPEELLPQAENLRKFERLGADFALVKPFTKEFAAMCPENYIELLADKLRVKAVVIGENYTFGRGGKGNPEMVRRLATKYGYRAKVVEPVCDEGGMISSTRIRTLLRAGKTEEANAMLDIREQE